MVGDTKPVPLSPRQGPTQIGDAAMQWARSRRGRVLVASVVLLFVFLGIAGARHSETITSSYHAISSNYNLHSWHAHAVTPTSSPLKPSNTTLELENGEIEEVPAHLTKATPNFHLLMLAADEDDNFCKTTLSAMLLNLPPPTIVNLYEEFGDAVEEGKARLQGMLRYLSDEKKVKDEDLVLVVDGRDTWFQLPSEVIIRQYQNVLADAEKRLARNHRGNYTQTIVFGAVKTCDGEDLACKYFPPSTLPDDVYGKETGNEVQRTPAMYLDSNMLMGPAKDLRTLYEAANQIFEEKKSQQATVQSVMATILAEQQMARNAQEKELGKIGASKWLDYFGGSAAEHGSDEQERFLNISLEGNSQHEFKIGLDYTHTLFQPLKFTAADELIPLIHDTSTDLSRFRRPGASTPPLAIPTALQQAKLPFWYPDFQAHNPSPNEKPAYIDKLEINSALDRLKHRDTTWDEIKLIQNPYTGAIPAIFHVTNRPPSKIFRSKRSTRERPLTEITWKTMWYATYSRALLRKYFRNPQSPVGYHTAAIGGDRLWDMRGGRGGVWTEKEALWLAWGEVDGVCGSVRQMRNVFADGKGVWLHELDEGGGEKDRERGEREFTERILEGQREEAERLRKVEEEGLEREREERLRQIVDLLRVKFEEQYEEDEKQSVEDGQEQEERAEREREQQAYGQGLDLPENEDFDKNDGERH